MRRKSELNQMALSTLIFDIKKKLNRTKISVSTSRMQYLRRLLSNQKNSYVIKRDLKKKKKKLHIVAISQLNKLHIYILKNKHSFFLAAIFLVLCFCDGKKVTTTTS